jgi:hypothetical protein
MIKLKQLITETNESTTDDNVYPPMMYSEKGFSCKVCKFLGYNKDEDRWTCSNAEYQKYNGGNFGESRAHYLLDDNGQPIEDPSKWCSNWFLPKQ